MRGDALRDDDEQKHHILTAQAALDKAMTELNALQSGRPNQESANDELKGPPEPPFCSFCGKGHNHVRNLVAGPKVFICDECVALCQDIISAQRKGKA